jgi:hypothetical protein
VASMGGRSVVSARDVLNSPWYKPFVWSSVAGGPPGVCHHGRLSDKGPPHAPSEMHISILFASLLKRRKVTQRTG